MLVLEQQEDLVVVVAEILQEELLNNLARHQEVLALQADPELPVDFKLLTIRHTVAAVQVELAELEVKVLAAPVVSDIKILSQAYPLITQVVVVAIYSMVICLVVLEASVEAVTVATPMIFLIQLLVQVWTELTG
jgi:hypothetical protein